VLYDYWSHDIGGHVTPAGFSKLDPELYTRWMQYGALSPIFRTHSTKNSLLNKEPWNFSGIYADAINHAIRLRYELAPYIYTMARKTYDSAVGLCRPLYYDYPGSENAYTFKTEYQFGDDLLVAPIGAPADSGITVKQVWLPEGNDWYEWNTGTLLKGGSILDRPFSIDEYPLYVKAGAIIPMNGDTIQDLNGQPETVHVGIFPGAAGKGRLYEDDGDNKDYSKNYSITSFSTALDKSDIRLAIAPVLGGFKGMRKTRNYVISFYGRVMPASIIVSGQPVSYGVEGKYAHWYYDGRQVSINLVIPDVDVREGKQIVVHFKKGDKPDINGLPEKLKRLYDITEKLKYEDAFLVLPHRIAEMEELGRAMEYYPDKYTQLVNDFNRDYQELPAMIQASGLRSEKKEELLKVLSAWIRQ
jgi:hypothetical protein